MLIPSSPGSCGVVPIIWCSCSLWLFVSLWSLLLLHQELKQRLVLYERLPGHTGEKNDQFEQDALRLFMALGEPEQCAPAGGLPSLLYQR